MKNTENNKQRKVKVRGTGTYDPETSEFGFKPFEEGPSSQANVKNCKGGGKSWETVGSDPSLMLSLKCKKSSPDRYAELSKQFIQLTKDMKPEKPVELPTEQRVVNEQGLQCWLDEENGTMTFTGTIDLSRNSNNWQAETLRLVQLVVRRLPACESFNKVINEIKKGGNK
jgi:hypothetical protein